MKTVLFFALLFSSMIANAQSDIVCNVVSKNASVQTTVVLNSTIPTNIKIKIYRSFYGHTAPPMDYKMQSSATVQSHVLAYTGDELNRILVINLQERTSENKALGTFLDSSVSLEPVRVICDL